MSSGYPSETDYQVPAAPAEEQPQGVTDILRKAVLGEGRDLRDPGLHHKLSLIAFLAWVGLGADGLSSSAYGPEEAFRALGDHTAIAVFLAAATALTVFIISYSYSRIIEQFPMGGGGYLVATQLISPKAGAVSGCALLVDYVLTITVSIAAGGAAVFSLLPTSWAYLRMPSEISAIVLLIVLNLRGVKESVTALIPIFLTFVVSHVILIGGVLVTHIVDLPEAMGSVRTQISESAGQLGLWGMFLVFLRAYSLGAGTYTGIEAVSNGVSILREPKVETGKRTMLYMAVSLAFTAGGLLLCYMLVNVQHEEGRTLNAILARDLIGNFAPLGIPVGSAFVMITIASEAVLLLVAAQAGFFGGPRVMASMSGDGWLPRRFHALSDRLTMQNGVVMMGVAAVAILIYSGGNITFLVVMYSINVFVTFSLSQLGMVLLWGRNERKAPKRTRNLILHAAAFLLCGFILTVMVVEKFGEGGWLTLLITGCVLGACVGIRRHYAGVTRSVIAIDKTFASLPQLLKAPPNVAEYDPTKPTGVILVGGYGGLGIHLLLNVVRLFPDTFHNFHFLSVGVIDSQFFTDPGQVERLRKDTRATMERYVELARKMGRPAHYTFRIGTDVVEEASEMCSEISRQLTKPVYFAGTLIFDRPRWYQRWLHNETAYAIQRRLRFQGLPILILPLPLSEAKIQQAARML